MLMSGTEKYNHCTGSVLGAAKQGEKMKEDTDDKNESTYNKCDHPWLEMPFDESLPEEIRCSLDEIRVG